MNKTCWNDVRSMENRGFYYKIWKKNLAMHLWFKWRRGALYIGINKWYLVEFSEYSSFWLKNLYFTSVPESFVYGDRLT